MANPLTTYHSIYRACYQGDLTTAQADKMKKDITALGITGKGIMVLSAGGLYVSYCVYQIPFVGGLVGGVFGAVSVAAGILGYDINTAANNLQEYANNRFWNAGKNLLNKAVGAVTGDKDLAKRNFAKELFDTTAKNTFIVKSCYDYIVVQAKN